MTTSQVLEVMKQKIGQAVGEVGGECPTYLDGFLIKYIETINWILVSMGLDEEVVVDANAVSITPDPTNKVGLLLAYGAASNLISDDLAQKVKSGELGLSFSTATTEITTNQAAITLSGTSKKLWSDFNSLFTAYMSEDPNTIIERQS